MLSQYPFVDTDANIIVVYTEGITVKNKEWKKIQKVWWRAIFIDRIAADLNTLIKSIYNI